MATEKENPFQVIDYSNDANDLAAQGKKDALASKPGPGVLTPPQLFLTCRARLKSLYDIGVDRCQEELNGIEARVDILDKTFVDSSLRSKTTNIIDQAVFRLTQSEHKAECRFHKEEFDVRKQNLEGFKLENDLVFMPEAGTSEKVVLGVSLPIWIIIALYLIESIFNAGLFVTEVGLIGGLTISLSSSLVNVIVGFLVGRYLFSRIYLSPKTASKVVAGFLFVGYLFAIVYMNLMIALYRSLKAAENLYATVNTSDAAWPFPHLAQLDFESSLVLMVGFVFALVSLIDGHLSDEPFPGYGHKYRLCVRAREKVKKELEAYKNEMLLSSEKASEDLAGIFEKARDAIIEWGVCVNTVQRRFLDFTAWAGQLQKGQELLWDSYCTSHQAHRLTGYVVPEVFQDPPKMFELGDNYAKAESIFGDVKDLHMTDGERKEKMNEYESAFKKIHEEAENNLKSQFLVLKEELKEIEKDAICHI